MATVSMFPVQARKEDQATPPSSGVRARITHFSGAPGMVFPVSGSPQATHKARTRTRQAATQEADTQQALLAKIHIALANLTSRAATERNLAGFCDDVYRFKLDDTFGVDSAAKLTNPQLDEVLQWLKSLGWKSSPGRHRRTAPTTLAHDPSGMSREARMEKIEALLTEKGRVEHTDMPWGYAVAILKRQTARAPSGQIKKFEDATPPQLDDVIAALYRDAKRKGRRVR